jgi:thiol-disulfide isomerase/thioredoxin
VYEKTLSQELRGKVGFRLVNLAFMRQDDQAAAAILDQLVDDKYMGGVKIGARSVKEWAAGHLLEIRSLKVGEALPNVKGQSLDGKTHSIADYRGQVLVVDVWATWCGPCRAMIPHEREMSQRLKDKPFKLLSVSCDEEQGTLKEFLEKTPMPWDHWWVGRGGEFMKALNIHSYPTIYVLDTKGVIRYKNIRGEKLEEAVNKLLAEAK